MTKVCHMTSAHGEEDVRIFHKECVSLSKAGYEVFLVERGASYDKNGVHIVGVGEMPSSRRKRMTEGARKVYEAARVIDADIYHFHDPELLPYGMKLKRAGKKVIFDSHEHYTEQLKQKPYLPGWVTNSLAEVYGVYEKHVLSKLDAVIFPCTMEGKDPFEGLCRHTEIISNAALLEEFYDHYDPSVPKQRQQICYVGSLTEERGISASMHAAKKAGATLALAGPFGSEAYKEKLRADPDYSGVEYHGILGREQVRTLIAQSEVGICTLLNKGQYHKVDNFSVKVYEFLSMGLPIILSHMPYNDRMTEKYQFGICVDPNNVTEYADTIRYLLDHPDEAQRMGENGRRAVETEFNWGVEEKKLLALYQEIMKE